MITDKVLIVHDYLLKKNEGGPRGYYYKCLHNNLPENVKSLKEEANNLGNISVIKKIQIRFDRLSGRKYKNKLLANNLIKVPKYKYLYFHDMHSFKDAEHLITKDQVIIYQSHSPELPSEEEEKLGATGDKLASIKKLEQRVFGRANVLILPNQGCLPIYESVIKKQHKILYIPTGIKSIEASFTYPIVQDDFVNILYIGRRNQIKGFDVLIDNFKKAVINRKDIRLFIIGGGDSIMSENIVDIGFSSNVYSWIKSVDFVISTNEKSYFDLNILETIALGTPLLMTTTEGHSYFKNKSGIISFTQKNLGDLLNDTKIITKSYKKENQDNLLDLYKNELSDMVFNKNIENTINEFLNRY